MIPPMWERDPEPEPVLTALFALWILILLVLAIRAW